MPRASKVGLLRAGAAAPPAGDDTRPRIVVLTDIGVDVGLGSVDPDDHQSLVKFLVWSNEFQIVGLVATYDEDNPAPNKTRPDLLDDILDLYALDRPNLAAHATGYPDAGALKAMVVAGAAVNTVASVTNTSATAGSNAIIAAVDAGVAAGKLTWIAIWGGQVDLLQALHDAARLKSAGAFTAFLANIRANVISDQDPGVSAEIRSRWPTLWYIENGPISITNTMDRQFRGTYQNDSDDAPQIPLVHSSQFDLMYTPWIVANVRGHGALGDYYPTAVEQYPITPNNHSIATGGGEKAGDAPTWYYLLNPGMQDPAQPSWGGWGGRFDRVSNDYFTDALDDVVWPEGATPTTTSENTACRRKWALTRWRKFWQNEFAARMDWARTPSLVGVNHHPTAVLNGNAATKTIFHLAVDGGATVNLSAAGSTDPDAGQTLSYRWWQYKEVTGTYGGLLSITGATAQACSFVAPNQNTTIHIILEVIDNGTPPLIAYRRAVVTVTAVVGVVPLDATFWLRAEDAGSFTLSGSNVTAAANQGSAGSALNLTPPAAGNQPLRVTGVVNGKAVLRFAGDDWLRTSAAVAASAFLTADQNVIVLVMKQTASQVQNTQLAWRTVAATDRFVSHLSYADVLYYESGNSTDGQGRISAAQPAGWDDAWHIVELVRNGGTAQIIVDGVERATGAVTVGISLAASAALTIGAQYADTSPFVGDLAEILVARGSGAVDATARATLRQALATYYGITLPTPGVPTVAVPLVDQNATVGSAFSYQFAAGSFVDPEAGALTYTATLSSGAALPAWLTFTPATRTLSGTPATGDIGTITVRVTATDPTALAVSDDFTLTTAAAAGAPAGTLKTAGEEPIAAGLVFFAGSAPTGSALIMRDQIAAAAPTLTGTTPATLTRAHPSKAGWVGADFALSNSAIYWALSTQLKTVTTAHTVWMHVVLDSGESFSSLMCIPRSDTAYSDSNDGPIRWRRGSVATEFRNMVSTTATGRTSIVVDPGVALWTSLGEHRITFRRSGADTSARVGGTQAAATGFPTGAILWPTTSHLIVSAPHRTRLGTDGRWDGGLFTLAIWDRALSDAEVAALEANPLLLQHQ